MQDIEPYYNWRQYYIAEEDSESPFYGREYSEFTYSERVYNFYLHPQWDNIGSETLFVKIIFADYATGHAIIELIGEWNDCINNDIMILKRDIIDELTLSGIDKYVLIGENILNFHYSDDSYYEEWFDENSDGWVVALNFQEHVLREFSEVGVDQYFLWGGELDDIDWRTYNPQDLILKLESIINKRLL